MNDVYLQTSQFTYLSILIPSVYIHWDKIIYLLQIIWCTDHHTNLYLLLSKLNYLHFKAVASALTCKVWCTIGALFFHDHMVWVSNKPHKLDTGKFQVQYKLHWGSHSHQVTTRYCNQYLSLSYHYIPPPGGGRWTRI